jgi:hypothetical protein
VAFPLGWISSMQMRSPWVEPLRLEKRRKNEAPPP